MDKKINPWITRLVLLPLGAALIMGTSAPSWAENPSRTAKRVLPKEYLHRSYRHEVERPRPQRDESVYSREREHQGYKHVPAGRYVRR